MTDTQAELRTRAFKKVMGDVDMPEDGNPAYDEWLFNKAFDAALALLPPAPAVSEALEECKGLLRVMIERDPHATITDSDAGQWKMIDEWRHRARKALAALGEGGAWSGWHPMSEAPKDGSEFLGIYWNPDHGHEPDYSLLRWDDQVKAFVGYCDGERSIKAEGDRWTDYHTPFCTHWCPLPEPKPLGDAPIPPSEGE